MTVRPVYFLGGVRHGEWLDLDDRMHHVQMPRINAPQLWPSPDFDTADITLSTDLYRVQQVVIVVDHPCVPHAALARFYSVAIWDGMPPGVQPPARELVERGVVESEHRGRLPTGEAPDWWDHPPGGLFAGFRAMMS